MAEPTNERQGPADILDLVKAYARQETVEPLQGVGRWVAMGLAGSVLLMIGGISLTMAMLRVLQEETGSTFTGNLSWAPYALTLGAAIIIIALLGWRITKRSL